MADFSHAPGGPATVSSPPIRGEEELTHHRKGPLGDMAVVPDNYVGPMPPNAVRESDYQRMASVYGNIEAGTSSISIDTSRFMQDADGKKLNPLADPLAYLDALGTAAAFKDQYMGYMRDLVRTPAGLQLLETLDQSKNKTRIQYGPDGNSAVPDDVGAAYLDKEGKRGAGTGSEVFVDPNEILWDDTEVCARSPEDRWQPWMRDKSRFSFYHELVHAYHNDRGDAAPGGGSFAQCSDYSYEIRNTEFQTAGIGPYASASVSENAIRAQMGAALRPRYGGASYHQRDPWAQQRDDEEPPLRSPAR